MIEKILVEPEGLAGESTDESGTGSHALDRFIGTSSAEEEAEVLEAIEFFEQVDESFWLASTLEDALALAVHRRQREAWLEENREAIEAYNEHVAQHGVFSTGKHRPSRLLISS